MFCRNHPGNRGRPEVPRRSSRYHTDHPYLGAELNFHPHIHCIVSGGLSKDLKLKICGRKLFIPAKVLVPKFRGKFLSQLDHLYKAGKLSFSSSCAKLRNSYEWNGLRDKLYNKTWCPDIRETFNGFGNAIEYLGRYTHRITITNSRIRSVSETSVTITAKDYKKHSAIKEAPSPTRNSSAA